MQKHDEDVMSRMMFGLCQDVRLIGALVDGTTGAHDALTI